MISLSKLGQLAVLLWILVYTISFGVWTWKRKNTLGGIAVMLLAVISVGLPAYLILFMR